VGSLEASVALALRTRICSPMAQAAASTTLTVLSVSPILAPPILWQCRSLDFSFLVRMN
jgi:hypothetical protein